MKLVVLTLFFILNHAGASELYTVGEERKIISLPSRFYTQLQRVQKEYREVLKFEASELLYLEADKQVAYYGYNSKKLFGKKTIKDFEQEYLKLNEQIKVNIYYESNKNKPNQIFSLEEEGDNLVLKNLSTAEYIKFSKKMSQGISTVFGADFYKHRYVNIFSATENELAIMVDGKFYFYIRN